MSNGKVIKSSFEAPAWARNPHIQTIWPRFIQPRLPLRYTRERITLPDGDFVDLAWGPSTAPLTGLVILFHGLEGSINSHYANDMMATLSAQGWQVVLMHFRGCSGEVNTKPRAYHSGETGDAAFLIELLNQRYPHLPKVAMGFSLGGNMLLKLLGESPNSFGLLAAVSVSAPLKLDACATSIDKGFSKIYQKYLLSSMKRNLLAKMQRINFSNTLNVEPKTIAGIQNFWQFDDVVTAPLHGFSGAKDYYQQCSGYQFLKKIHCPTLILHALDDPFMNTSVVPLESDLSSSVTVELSNNGGHVGFMCGTPLKPKVWLHQRATRFFSDFLPTAKAQ